MYSNAKIDNSGKALSRNTFSSEDHELEAEIIFDDYRRSHLQPLTDSTMQIQSWLSGFDGHY